MSNLKGTVLITGANGGLGTAFVSQFLSTQPNYHGIFTVRSLNGPSSSTLEKLTSTSSHPHEILPVDLSSLADIRRFAHEINAKVARGTIPRIKALVLNAAVQHVSGQRYTTDGFESTFAVNYLANFLLVGLLLGSMCDDGRVVIVSSMTHDPEFSWNSSFVEGKEVFREPKVMARPEGEDKVGDSWKAGMRRYALSKTCMLMFMYSLSPPPSAG
jgi:NAD(P)-dependent dehydrogenase (short-subunit alcohol dehydrogenase family)